ncbi:hypothetical protein SLNWT_0898 [Streptomyces albus]|uniref:Uncharacterized protein n=1 Tax=Streptomyces albus (strain ATCC 21838 / DSM 41398 / FERM P-419 / JCM 4703 / NBRC 107858) TaxID=1081613 RepID=A0A0B5EII7_STRA4|nr:hypothetical protein SLNWT_0898 [Streptomyces albus]AOU75589.1 hypothetical protein SLNHY_0898 [Streptomyces albus]AYN31394.1 hypothetical protein DUI70_0891 [Streptomyces albus]
MRPQNVRKRTDGSSAHPVTPHSSSPCYMAVDGVSVQHKSVPFEQFSRVAVREPVSRFGPTLREGEAQINECCARHIDGTFALPPPGS